MKMNKNIIIEFFIFLSLSLVVLAGILQDIKNEKIYRQKEEMANEHQVYWNSLSLRTKIKIILMSVTER